MRPRYITVTRSETYRTTFKLCETKSIDMLVAHLRRFKSSNTCAWIETSRDATGSSHARSTGRSATARAIAARWSCPPDMTPGMRPAWCAGIPTMARTSIARALAAALSRPWCTMRGSATWSTTGTRGSKHPYGSCQIIWRAARCACQAGVRGFGKGSSLKRTDPSVGS